MNDTMVKNNIINFSERPKEAQEKLLQTATPTASEVVYYTLSAVTRTGFFVATGLKLRQVVRYETPRHYNHHTLCLNSSCIS